MSMAASERFWCHECTPGQKMKACACLTLGFPRRSVHGLAAGRRAAQGTAGHDGGARMIETNPATTHERIGEQSIVHRRGFAAISAQVQRAHTDAEIFSRWMGPRGSRMRIQHFDARTGGSFDYTVEMDGDWRFWGSYHKVADGRIVHSWEFEAEPGHPTFETLEFR